MSTSQINPMPPEEPEPGTGQDTTQDPDRQTDQSMLGDDGPETAPSPDPHEPPTDPTEPDEQLPRNDN
jgi:hypothetical protein